MNHWKCWAVLVLAHPLTTSAITVRNVSFDEICRRAEVIVSGTVREHRYEASPDGAHVLTFTRFDDLVWIKGKPAEGQGDDGAAGESYEVCTLGGRLGDLVEKIPGMPTFEVGERFVLFLEGNGKNLCPIIGVHQGCFRVESSADGTKRVRTYHRRLVTGLEGGRLRMAASSTSEQQSMRLERFLDIVKRQLAKEASK